MTTATVLKKLSMTTAGAVFISLGIGGAAHAAAINFDSPTVNFHNGNNWSLGFQFSTKNQITVNQLGFYDDFKNDLTQSHNVGIFTEAGQLLVSGTVNPGDPLDGWFRYTSVTPTVLNAGQTFRIAAETGSENYTWNPIGFQVDPNINFITFAYQHSSTLVFPTQLESGYNGDFGPNFKTEPVPEPSTLAGTLLAGGIGLVMKRKQAGFQKAKA